LIAFGGNPRSCQTPSASCFTAAQPNTGGPRFLLQRRLIVGRDQTDVRLAAAGDQETLSGACSFHVPAKVVTEDVGADGFGFPIRGMELGGLEPPASGMPYRRSAQLSYSPRQFVIGGPV
jgi:hypothetical protein